MRHLPSELRRKRVELHRRARTLGFQYFVRKGAVPSQLTHIMRVTESDDAFLTRRYRPKGDRDTKGVREDRVVRFAELRRVFDQAKADGKTVKIWRTQKDGKVRESHAVMDGVAVGIDERFEVAGDLLFLPSDPSGSPDETANCRCFVEYEVASADLPADVKHVQSSFDVQIRYFDRTGTQRTGWQVGPGQFQVSGGSGLQEPKIRLRSHSIPISIQVVIVRT